MDEKLKTIKIVSEDKNVAQNMNKHFITGFFFNFGIFLKT